MAIFDAYWRMIQKRNALTRTCYSTRMEGDISERLVPSQRALAYAPEAGQWQRSSSIRSNWGYVPFASRLLQDLVPLSMVTLR
jgi:hypothetical protein